MSKKELQKLEIVHDVQSGRLKQTEAAEFLSVADRGIRRWIAAVVADGPEGLIHGNRGKDSPRKVPDVERKKILTLIQTTYPDFGPTFATEKLRELHGIHRDPTTIREIMVDEGLWIPRSKRGGHHGPVHRTWRERRAHRGELAQFDGSYHPWLEDRLLDAAGLPKELCLLASIDDATGDLGHLQFVSDEGVLPVMTFWTQYTHQNGLPRAIYLDRFSTYKMTQDAALQNPDLKTQLQRAMDTLGVQLIFALSPQAKGRVERLFKTLQDRLVKELRIRQISTVEDANLFLTKTFLPAFNRSHHREPREAADFHRPLSKRELEQLPQTLCRMEQRIVHNDFTVSFQRQWYQLLPTSGLAIRPKDTVLVREYPNSSISFSIRNKQVNVKPILKQREVKSSARTIIKTLVPV